MSNQHVCTLESCPPSGDYYVTAIPGPNRIFKIAGPYPTHASALLDIENVQRIACALDEQGNSLDWGTRRVAGERTPGALNRMGYRDPERIFEWASLLKSKGIRATTLIH
jgi:hypothetical protein